MTGVRPPEGWRERWRTTLHHGFTTTELRAIQDDLTSADPADLRREVRRGIEIREKQAADIARKYKRGPSS